MKSWVISLSRWSDGAHHSSPAPQISLYLSSTSIQQNNSPKSLSIFHTLPPPPPLCILFYFAIWKAEAYGLCLSVLCSSLYAIKTEREQTGWRGEWNGEQIMFITGLFTCFHLHHFPFPESNCTLGGMASSDIRKNTTQTQGDMRKGKQSRGLAKGWQTERQTAVPMEIAPTINDDNSLCFQLQSLFHRSCIHTKTPATEKLCLQRHKPVFLTQACWRQSETMSCCRALFLGIRFSCNFMFHQFNNTVKVWRFFENDWYVLNFG